jgi:rare lipoprotein A
MNVSYPKRDQVGSRLRSLFATAALLLFLSLTCHAADQASWYGEAHRGQRMANGHRFDPDNLTAASWFYPIGTKVVVTHDDQSVVVEITDRGPARRLVQEGRKIDLSWAAFAKLADPDLGLIDVSVRKQ